LNHYPSWGVARGKRGDNSKKQFGGRGREPEDQNFPFRRDHPIVGGNSPPKKTKPKRERGKSMQKKRQSNIKMVGRRKRDWG